MDVTLYDVLEVNPNASREVILMAYKTLAKKYHPDSYSDNRDYYEEKMKLINRAKEVLTNDELRRQYDIELNASKNNYGYSINSEKYRNYYYEDRKSNDNCIELETHPWMRYFARMFDSTLEIFILVFLTINYLPSEYLSIFGNFSEYIIGIVFIIISLFIESYIISILGTTLGKWFFNIKVLNENGEKLKFKISLKRNFLMFVKGLGFGIPIVTLFTLTNSYSDLNQSPIGRTSWDIQCNSCVIVGNKRNVKMSMAIVIYVCILYLNYSDILYYNEANNIQEANDTYYDLENEYEILNQMLVNLEEQYDEFIKFEEQMIVWSTENTLQYNLNYDKYIEMLDDYNKNLEIYESKRRDYNQKVDKYNESLE